MPIRAIYASGGLKRGSTRRNDPAIAIAQPHFTRVDSHESGQHPRDGRTPRLSNTSGRRDTARFQTLVYVMFSASGLLAFAHS